MAVNVWQGVQQGQQLVDNLFRQRDQMQAGRALATGDYGSAMRALGAGGDVQGVRQIQADQVQAQTRAREETERQQGKQLETTLQVVRTLKRARDANQPLDVLVEQYRPVFASMGTDPAQYDQIAQQIAANPEYLDVMENALGDRARKLQIQNLGGGYGVAIDEATGRVVQEYRAPAPDYTLGQTRFSGATNAPVAQAERAPEFIQRDPTKELIEIPGSPAAGPAGGAPRGIRNNNPGNIEDSPFTRSLPGYAGSDGRFAIFDTPEAGVAAGARLLDSYARRGLTTPAEIINRWAPPSDNNPTQAYAQYVAQRLGIGVNDPIPAERRGEAFQAINEFENGTRGPSRGPAPAAGPRVLAAARDVPGVTILSDAEKAELGITNDGTYQRDRQGRISLVSGTGPEKPEKFTEGQRSAAAFSYRTQQASNELRQLESQGIRTPSPQILLGDGTLNTAIRSQTDRQFMQAARNWLAPILRKDTGAAVTDTEMVYYMDIYIPRPGDGPEVLAQKARARADAERALRAQAGRAYDEMFAGAPETTRQPRVRFALSPQQQAWVAQNGQAEESGRTPRRAGSRENPRLINPANATQSYNNIPSGSYFLTPDGQLRQKR